MYPRRGLVATLAFFFFLVPIRAVNAQLVDENNGWNGNYVSSIGETGSDFYAQSFLANVATITKIGVVIREIEAEGELVLAIAADNGSGVPDVNAPLYQGALRNPSTTGAWFHETVNVPVTVGQKYWVLIDGYNNAGATGRSSIGLSSAYTDTGEGMIYSNAGGVGSWSSIPSMPLAIYVAGAKPPVVNNGWNGSYISSVGETGSDFYAQSFLAKVVTITQFGVAIREIDAQGELVLAIAADNGSGAPDVNAPLYQGALRDPAATGAWFYEDGISLPVTVGQKYWVLIDGYNNAGATGRSAIGRSSAYTDTGEGMIYSNAGGVGSWSSIPSMPLAIFVAGTAVATRFSVSAPGSAVMGSSFSVTVTAKDLLDNTVASYPGTVHFTSSDGSATLPADAMLTNGVGTFSATLNTPGSQTITATDTVTSSITGTSGPITTAVPVELQRFEIE